jgi:hypothetical protein
MPNLSIASQIAFSLAAYEAQALKSKFIDSEHLFLGLCKVEDILFLDKTATISEDDRKRAQGVFTPLEIMPRCSAAELHCRIIPAGFNALLEFLMGFTMAGRFCKSEAEDRINLKTLFLLF